MDGLELMSSGNAGRVAIDEQRQAAFLIEKSGGFMLEVLGPVLALEVVLHEQERFWGVLRRERAGLRSEGLAPASGLVLLERQGEAVSLSIPVVPLPPCATAVRRRRP